MPGSNSPAWRGLWRKPHILPGSFLEQPINSRAYIRMEASHVLNILSFDPFSTELHLIITPAKSVDASMLRESGPIP